MKKIINNPIVKTILTTAGIAAVTAMATKAADAIIQKAKAEISKRKAKKEAWK